MANTYHLPAHAFLDKDSQRDFDELPDDDEIVFSNEDRHASLENLTASHKCDSSVSD